MAKEINKEQEAVMSAVSKTEEFFNKYSKALWISLAVLVILCGAGYLTYRYAYLPKKAEALGQMYKAEANFRAGNYELALYPSQAKVKVLSDRNLNEDALQYMMVVLDVVNSIEPDVSEIDLRYGAVSYRRR